MPEFVNPFVGMVPRKMTKEELIRAIRLNITAEHEAVHLYMAHADATDDPLAKKVLIDVANEERVHIGEFQRLLSILAPDEDILVGEGVQEVEEMRAGLSGSAEAQVSVSEGEAGDEIIEGKSPEEMLGSAQEEPAQSTAQVKTIGSLINKE